MAEPVPAEQQLYREQIVAAQTVANALTALSSSPERPLRFSEVNTLEVTTTVAGLPAQMVDSIVNLAGPSHLVRAIVQPETYRCEIEFLGDADPTVVESGYRPSDLTTDEFDAAYERGDGAEALRLAASAVTAISLTLTNDPGKAGQHWIATLADLQAQLAGRRWSAVVDKLADGPAVLVVQDAADASISGEHLQICGPDAPRVTTQPLPVPLCPAHLAGLPTPSVVDPAFRGLLELLQGVVRTLVWSSLADQHSDSEPDGTLVVSLSGARIVQLRLHPNRWAGKEFPAADDLRFWWWATAGEDPGRRHSAVQAATLAIVDPVQDLPSAAEPALRNAQHLYDLSRQTAVAESLASQRSAREAAATAARAAVTASREVTAKSLERLAVQAAAVVGVIVARAAAAISTGVAVVGTGLLLALTIASGIINRKVLIDARSSLDNDLHDLDQYRTAVGSAELVAVKNSQAIAGARAANGSARRVNDILSMAVIVVLIALIVLLLVAPWSAVEPPGSTTTVTTLPATPAVSTP